MRLKYWVRAGFVTSGVMLLAASLYTVYMSLVLHRGDSLWADDAISYFLMLGSVMVSVYTFTHYRSLISVVMSFGSSRKEAFVGLQVFRLIQMATVLAAVLVLAQFDGCSMTEPYLLQLCVGALLFSTAIAMVSSNVAQRFARTAGILYGVLLAATIALGSMWIAFAKIGLSPTWLLVMDAVGVLLYGVMLFVEYRTLQKWQVML